MVMEYSVMEQVMGHASLMLMMIMEVVRMISIMVMMNDEMMELAKV